MDVSFLTRKFQYAEIKGGNFDRFSPRPLDKRKSPKPERKASRDEHLDDVSVEILIVVWGSHSRESVTTKKMSDVNTLLIEPLTKFVKDSAYLVKKCTKPDHKGITS